MTDTDIKSFILIRIDEKKKLLDARRPLPAGAVRRLHEEFRLAHTYNSNAIEGNTLTMQETRLVVEEGITIGGKSIREHLEASGNAKAFDRVVELTRENKGITHVAVQELHEIVTKGIQADAGRYRTVNVRIAGVPRSPPDFSKVPRSMDALLRKVNTMDSHPVIASTVLHHGLVQIHPFSDGNGRVARLLANLYLMRRGYPPVILKKEDRKKYYRCLAQADAGNLDNFTIFIARALDESLTIYLATFGGQDSLLPLSELAKGTAYSQEYLSLRARQGILSAVKVGKAWHSSKRALGEYAKEHGR